MFESVDAVPNFPEIEEKILKFWKDNKVFEKSIEQRPEHKTWTFLDGPPFVTGMPHYGSLLSSLPKDLFGRYWTMKGYRVRRVWGWDGHGLPIENKVEGELKITRKRDIEEKVGVKKFIEECKKYVGNVSAEWEWYVDHIGRWVDFKNAYRTWDTAYMESVMWVFKQMYDKGYIYKGLRVSLYCPHCATPISNFEVAMDAENYKDVTESAPVYKYELADEKNTYLLAWSTTPWNKIVTPALAVNPKLDYVKVRQGDEHYILAKDTVKMLKKDPEYKVVETFKGKELVGKNFIPHYDYYKIDKDKKAFVIIAGDFVTADEGTGVVTLAVYGEEDLEVMQKENIQLVFHVDEEGTIKEDVPQFGGMFYLKANKAVNTDLAKRGLIYKEETYTHSVAYCWRCATRLFYNPQNAWYVNVQDLKPLMKKTNEKVNWYPEHFKKGRFLKSMEHAPDWNISRNRYWGSPVPVWECECGERFVPGSISELEKASGKKIADLHKPEIDDVVVQCKKCKKDVKRTPEVLDSWIEAGSASFAERHFPFNDQEKLEDFFPPDFIAEYTGQIRAWFYVLHVIGAALYESPAFKNVLVEGVILGTDGRKMSKNFKNYPDPKEMLNKYGGDALRLYLMGSPVMKGEDMLIAEEPYKNQVRGLLLILWNVYKFFVTYANLHKFSYDNKTTSAENVLDRWINSRLNESVQKITKNLDSYNTMDSISEVQSFVDDLSNWYVRRSRDRVSFSADKKEVHACLSTLYSCLVTVCQLLAPIAPFIAEDIYKNLTGKESVHLDDWPVAEAQSSQDLIKQMKDTRTVASAIHMRRRENSLKVKDKLLKVPYTGSTEIDKDLAELIKDEVNAGELVYMGKSEVWTSPESPLFKDEDNVDKVAGRARELIRQIQIARKEMGSGLDEMVDVCAPDWPKEYEKEIKTKALINSLQTGEFKVVKSNTV